MFAEIVIHYFHPGLNIGIQDVRNAWHLTNPPVKLSVTMYRGALVFRLPGSVKRISYHTLKKGIIKKEMVIRLPVQLLPF